MKYYTTGGYKQEIIGEYIHGAAESLQGGRIENQDDFDFVKTPFGDLLVLCDGMGGMKGGKRASFIAKTVIVDTIRNGVQGSIRMELVRRAIENANTAIQEDVSRYPSLKGMGTTVVVLLINKNSAVVGHVGDSRLYKIRRGHVLFRTKDHSLVGKLVEKKELTEEQARLSTQSNILMRAVGSKSKVEVDLADLAFEKGDRFVMCTDGVWGVMSNKELVKQFSAKKDASIITDNVATLVDNIGKSKGGEHDNLTLLVVDTSKDSKKKEDMSKRTMLILALLSVILLISIVTNVMYINRYTEVNKENISLSSEVNKRDSLLKKNNDSLKVLKEKERASTSNYKKNKLNAEIERSERERIQKEKNDLSAKISSLSQQNQKLSADVKRLNEENISLKNKIATSTKTKKNNNNKVKR